MSAAHGTAASVRQRLLNLARTDHRPFEEVLQYDAMERFLYRLSCSRHADRFILKGALMLRVWKAPEIRPTMDIDMLGRTSNDEASIAAQVREVLDISGAEDGLEFDPASLRIERITGSAEYEGARILVPGRRTTAKFVVQIDIGFGDALFPPPEVMGFPTLPGSPVPRLACDSRESVIAKISRPWSGWTR